MIKKIVLLLWLVAAACAEFSAFAQQASPKRNLTSLLTELSTYREVRISFSPTLTDREYPQNTNLDGTLDEVLTRLLRRADLDYRKISDTYYYIYPVKKPRSGKSAPKPKPKAMTPKLDTVAQIRYTQTYAPIKAGLFFKEKGIAETTVNGAYLPTRTLQEDLPLPRFALKTNLLYDATTTMNLGMEFGLGKKWSLDISGNYNPWTFSDNRKMKHWLVQPELRLWTCRRFSGHFFGLHGHYAQYNMGGMLPWGFKTGKMFGSIKSDNMLNHRYEGWLAGAGISYGYHWILGNRWGLEAEIGGGYAYLHYDKSPCERCGRVIATENKHYFGPTKASISLVFIIK